MSVTELESQLQVREGTCVRDETATPDTREQARKQAMDAYGAIWALERASSPLRTPQRYISRTAAPIIPVFRPASDTFDTRISSNISDPVSTIMHHECWGLGRMEKNHKPVAALGGPDQRLG